MHYLNTDPSLDKIKEAYPEFRKALNNFKKPPELDPENRIFEIMRLVSKLLRQNNLVIMRKLKLMSGLCSPKVPKIEPHLGGY